MRPDLDVLDLAVQLMSIESTSGQEGALVAWLHERLAGLGWHVRRIAVEAGRDDLLATIDEGSVAPRVTFSTHLDTVPPFIPPRVADGVLWGRGACDAKGIAAAMICAATRLRDRGLPAALLFVVGEETAHDGAHAADEYLKAHFTGLDAGPGRALVNGEPTEGTLARGTKGAMRLVVRTTGQAAHSAYPHLGRSATRDLVKLLADLDALELPRDELLGDTTVNIGRLEGGVADNVVAPSAEARLMVRLVSPADEVWAILERWAAGRASLDRGPTVPAVRLGALPGFPTSIAAYATDIPALPAWGTPYLYGPGSIHVAHRDDEHVGVEEIRRAVEAYLRMGEELGGG